MYITLTKQNKHSKELEVYESTWDSSNYGNGTPAEIIRSFYQFHEGYEPVPWIADNMTEDQFNELYDSGQRLFWLEETHNIMIVKIEDNDPWSDGENLQKCLEECRSTEELLDDLIVYCNNTIYGFYTQGEFCHIIAVFERFRKDGDKDKFNETITTIVDAIDKRIELK